MNPEPRLLSEFRSIVEKSTSYRVAHFTEVTNAARDDKAIVVGLCPIRRIVYTSPT